MAEELDTQSAGPSLLAPPPRTLLTPHFPEIEDMEISPIRIYVSVAWLPGQNGTSLTRNFLWYLETSFGGSLPLQLCVGLTHRRHVITV